MRILAAITLVLLGLAAGWFLRGTQEEPSGERSERAADTRDASRWERDTNDPPPPPPADSSDPEAPQPSAEPRPEPTTGAPAGDGEESEQKEQMAQFAQFLKGAMPLIKMQSKREAQEEAALLAKLLQLAPHREKQLAEALERSALRELENVLPLLEGKEPDVETLMNLEETDGMSRALENDLSLILNSNEMEQVREHYREREAEQRREQLESEFKELAIPDLTEDQERQVRDILRAEIEGDAEAEIPKSPGSLKKKLEEGLTEESLVAAVDESYRQRRAKLSRFLTPEQLAHLDKRHEAKKAETKAAAGLMQGFFGLSGGNVKVRVGGAPPSEPKKDEGDG